MIIFVWIVLGASVAGIAAIVLSKLPQVMTRPAHKSKLWTAADSMLDYFAYKFKQLFAWLWHFVLEAKDIRPSTKVLSNPMDKVKRAFRIRINQSEKDPKWMPEVTDTENTVDEQGKDKSAEDLYLETIRKDPSNRQAYEALGRLYLQEKNYAEAVEIFKYLVRSEPTRDVYWSNLGIALYAIKDFFQASQTYEQALKINGKVPARWINLALCFEALEEHHKAIKSINRALELDPQNANYLMLLADVYIKINNKVRSEEVLSQVLAAEPTNKIAREKLMKLRI